MAFIHHRTLRLGDTDAAGVIYFAQGLHLCHEAYEAALIAQGINFRDLCRQCLLPIVHADIDFYRPLTWGQVMAIHLTAGEVQDTEFTLHYAIHPPEGPGDRPLIQARTRHLCIEAERANRQPQRVTLPEEMRSWLNQLQSQEKA